MTEAEIQELRQVIHDVYGVASSHIRSEPVHELSHGETVWQGNVEVFAIAGHPEAKTVFAWSCDTDLGGRRFVTVLGVAPINTARDAVLAVIAREAHR